MEQENNTPFKSQAEGTPSFPDDGGPAQSDENAQGANADITNNVGAPVASDTVEAQPRANITSLQDNIKVTIEVSSESVGRGSPDQITIKEINSQEVNEPRTRNSYGNDVGKLGLDSGAGVTKERKAVKIVDLSGKEIKEDGGDKDKDSDSDSENKNVAINEIDNDTSLAYEKPFPVMSFYNMTKFIMKWSMHQFFRHIIILGQKNVPKRGPVVFCGNHANQFVDGSIVFFATPRDTRFMVAAKSFKRPILGSFFRWSHSVPVERAQDIVKKGTGEIEFEDITVIKGFATLFTKEFRPGDTIRVNTKEDEAKVADQIIEKIVSDTEMILKSPGAQIHEPEKKYKFSILPKVDQSTVFKHCVEALGKGGSIAMFPEGGSHDQSDLLPFKAGIALMVLGTIVETGQIPVIIPTGLKYFKPHEFRSDCVCEFGRPYKPSQKIIEMYKNGDKRKAVANMLSDLRDRMHEVTMTAPSYEELQAVFMARNLYLPRNIGEMTDEQENDIYQRFAIGYNKMKDDPYLMNLLPAVTSYRNMLKLFNVDDGQVKQFKQKQSQQIYLLIISFVRLCLSLIFCLPGNVIIFPLSVYISTQVEKERLKALAGSSVKIKANDVRSSVKILAYMSTYPFYVIGFTILFNRLMRWYYGFDSSDTRYYTFLFFIFYPIFSIIAIRSHDGVRTHYKEFQGRVLYMFYPGQVKLLQDTRKVLKKKVREAVDKIGPQVFKNFDKMRLIMKDPKLGQKYRKRNSSADNLDLVRNQHPWHNPQERNSNVSSSRMSQRSGASETKAFSNISEILTYQEQLELSQVFNITSMGDISENAVIDPQDKKDN